VTDFLRSLLIVSELLGDKSDPTENFGEDSLKVSLDALPVKLPLLLLLLDCRGVLGVGELVGGVESRDLLEPELGLDSWLLELEPPKNLFRLDEEPGVEDGVDVVDDGVIGFVSIVLLVELVLVGVEGVVFFLTIFGADRILEEEPILVGVDVVTGVVVALVVAVELVELTVLVGVDVDVDVTCGFGVDTLVCGVEVEADPPTARNGPE